MTRAETAQFIKDRAQALEYEARQYPRTAKTASEWLIRAAEWTRKHGDKGVCVRLILQAGRLDIFRMCPSLFPRKRARQQPGCGSAA